MRSRRLDVTQHMSLCRHYVRELRRSVLVETPELEKGGSKRSSAVLENMGDMNDPAGPSVNLSSDEKSQDQRLSAFLRSENGRPDLSQNSSYGSSQQSGRARSGRSGDVLPPRASFMSLRDHRTDSNSPAHTVARADIRASAEKILYTYLLPGSEREIGLPHTILTDITTSIEEDGRDDPEVFDAAKDYVFQAMERDAFPGFLRSKALGNLVPSSKLLRLVIGVVSLFGGFWGGFACILLDKPKHLRCWVCFLYPVYPSESSLTFVAAHLTVHRGGILPGLASVRARSRNCSARIQRVHLHDMVPDSRTLRPEITQQTYHHGIRSYARSSRAANRPIHLRARKATVVRFTESLELARWFGVLITWRLRRTHKQRLYYQSIPCSYQLWSLNQDGFLIG